MLEVSEATRIAIVKRGERYANAMARRWAPEPISVVRSLSGYIVFAMLLTLFAVPRGLNAWFITLLAACAMIAHVAVRLVRPVPRWLAIVDGLRVGQAMLRAEDGTARWFPVVPGVLAGARPGEIGVAYFRGPTLIAFDALD
jgi:hypothetical protein